MGKAADFCILGPALKVVGLRGDFKRGIIWNREGEMKAICVSVCVLCAPVGAPGQCGRRKKIKNKKNNRGA